MASLRGAPRQAHRVRKRWLAKLLPLRCVWLEDDPMRPTRRQQRKNDDQDGETQGIPHLTILIHDLVVSWSPFSSEWRARRNVRTAARVFAVDSEIRKTSCERTHCFAPNRSVNSTHSGCGYWSIARLTCSAVSKVTTNVAPRASSSNQSSSTAPGDAWSRSLRRWIICI